MVVLGLVLGVLVAILVASQGCGSKHHRRHAGVKPGGIVAMHDAGGFTRTETLEAVPHIVRGLRRRHIQLVTVEQLWDGRA
jgi:peptidoglycan/xylan/chitin deacetylase (PgdA/CDA1 family)